MNANQKGDEVYLIIRSMEPNEKRYFKLHRPNHNASADYITLFDIYDKMSSFSEQTFHRLLAEKGLEKCWMRKRDFLKSRILAAMRSYNAEKTIGREIGRRIENFRYLTSKGLYDSAIKELKRGKKLAQDYGYITHFLLILDLQQRYLIEHEQDKQLEKKLNGLELDTNRAIASLEAHYLWMNQYNRLILKYRTGKLRENWEVVFQLLKSTAAPTPQDHFAIHNYYHGCHALLSLARGDWKGFLSTYSTLKSLYESNDRTEGEFLGDYCKVLSNYLEGRRRLCKYDEAFEDALRVLESIAARKNLDTDQRKEAIQCWILYKILFVYNRHRWSEIESTVSAVEQVFRDPALRLNLARELSLKSNVMLLFFALEDWENVQKWARWILTDKLKRIRPDVIQAVQLIMVIVAHELEDEDLFELELRRARDLSQNEVYKEVLVYLRRIHVSNLRERQGKAEELATFLKEKTVLPPEVSWVGLGETYSWARSRSHYRYLADQGPNILPIQRAMEEFPYPPPRPI